MFKMKVKKDDADAFKKLTMEELEEVVCSSLDFLDESLVLLGFDTDGLVFDKTNIDDLFEILYEKDIDEMYYINESLQEIKIRCVDNSQLILLILG